MRFFTLLCLLTFTVPALAQDWNCENADDLPQQGMNYCAYVDWQQEDEQLNAIWPEVSKFMKDLDASNKENGWEQVNAFENLLKSQRAWIDYRDGHCEAEGAPFTGGSIQPLIINSCLAGLTKARTEQLKQLMQEF